MRKIQNDNITFRVTTDLKSRLTEFCLENDLHNSAVLRQALAKEPSQRFSSCREFVKGLERTVYR